MIGIYIRKTAKKNEKEDFFDLIQAQKRSKGLKIHENSKNRQIDFEKSAIYSPLVIVIENMFYKLQNDITLQWKKLFRFLKKR